MGARRPAAEKRAGPCVPIPPHKRGPGDGSRFDGARAGAQFAVGDGRPRAEQYIAENVTPQERLAAERYLLHGSKAQAMIEAGYAAPSVKTRTARVFNRPRVQAYLRHLQMQLTERALGAAQRTLAAVHTLAYSDMGNYLSTDADGNARVDVRKIVPGQNTSAIKRIRQRVILQGDPNDALPILETDIELHDKVKPLDMSMRHYGLYQADHDQGATKVIRFDVGALPVEERRLLIDALVQRIGDPRALRGEAGDAPDIEDADLVADAADAQ